MGAGQLPGTEVKYCIGYYNTPTAAAVTDLDIKFTLPANVEYLPAHGISAGPYPLAETEYNENTCELASSVVGQYVAHATAGNSVKATIPALAAGVAATMTFYGKIK